MSHRFSNAAGRLVKGAQSIGQGLSPAKESAGEIVYGPGFKVATVNTRLVSGGSSGGIDAALLGKYRKFQAPNHLPVHIKGGAFDRALLGLTTVLVGAGLVQVVHFIYTTANPKRE